MFSFRTIPKGLYAAVGIFSLIGLIGGYFLEVTAGFLVLILIFGLFWRPNTPPVILGGMLFQWLAVTVGYVYLSMADAEMQDLLWRPDYSLPSINKTYWLALGGLIFFSLGLKIPIVTLKARLIPASLLKNYNARKAIIAYIIYAYGSETILWGIRYVIPGLAQVLVWFYYFRWALFFMMIYVSLRKKENVGLMTGVVIVEVLTGFTGYFSAFKDVLIMLPLVYLTFNKIQGKKQVTMLTLFGILLFNLGAIWSYVKVEYRMFLSGGERAQIVTVDETEALSKLAELTADMTAETYQMGVEAMIKRIFFLEYFSATVNNIPQRQNYTDGENYEAGIKHVLMPRILFPDKKAIDDSKQTMKLTGIQLATASQGTSISVGFMAEAYADYGPTFMFIPIFFLGLLLGTIYKFFVRQIKNPLWAYAMIFPMYFLINIFGTNIIKIMGNTFMYFIVMSLILRFFIPYADRLIRVK